MAFTFHKIILDVDKLVSDMAQRENEADMLICEIQSVYNQVDGMRQYQEDLETLNSHSVNQRRQDVIAGFQNGNSYFRELQAENKDLRLALEDYQKALEQIMSKYRQQTAYFLRQTKNNQSNLPNNQCCADIDDCKCKNIIESQAEKLQEMAAVMKKAAEADEENEAHYLEALECLKKENHGLREIIEIHNKYYYPNKEASVENKTVQTEEQK